MTNETRGSKYSADLNTTQIAALVRADVKAAIANGELPKGIKVGVRSSRYAGGSSITVTINAFPGAVLNPARVYSDAIGFWEEQTRLLYTLPVRRACRTLEAIVAEYNRDASDSMVDHFDTNFYSHIDVRVDTRAERANLEAGDEIADLKVAKAAGVALFSMVDAHDLSGRNVERSWF